MIIKNDRPSKGIIPDEQYYKNLNKQKNMKTPSAREIMFAGKEEKDDSKVIFHEIIPTPVKEEVRQMILEDPSSVEAVFFRCLDPKIEFTRPIIIDVHIHYFYNNVIGIKFITKSVNPQETERVQVLLHSNGVEFMDDEHINNFTDAILISIIKDYCENNLIKGEDK